MKPSVDELLEAVRHLPAPSAADDPIDTADLIGLRAGALDADSAAALERRLLDDPDARALLVGLGEPGPPAAVRRAEAAFGGARRPLWIGLAVAAAVLLGLGLWSLRGPPIAWTPDPLTGAQAVRDPQAPTAPPRFLPDTPVVLILRPGTATEARPTVQLSVGREGRFTPVHLTGAWTPQGVWRLRTPASTLFPAPGDWTLRVEIGGDRHDLPARYQAAP